MPRFNTTQLATSITGTTTLTNVVDRGTIIMTGTAGYTLTLADPSNFPGTIQTIFNNTGGACTIAIALGNLIGNGFVSATSQTIPNNTTYTVTSDGTNYVISNNQGGPISVTSGTFSGTLTAQSTVTVTPANANVTISPTGTGTVTISPAGGLTISPTTAGSITNTSIGSSNPSTGAFTSATASTATPAAPGVSASTLTRKDYVDLALAKSFYFAYV